MRLRAASSAKAKAIRPCDEYIAYSFAAV